MSTRVEQLLQRLAARALREPQAPVVLTDRATLTAQSLWERSGHLASWLNDAGVERLALCADNGADWVVTDLACLRGGICLVGLPTFFSPGQRQHALAITGADMLLLGEEAAGGPRESPPAARRPDGLFELLAVALQPEQRRPLPAGTGKITFTSGSTGQPKGVCLSNDHCLAVAASLVETVACPESRHLSLLPLAVLLENVAGLYRVLLSSGQIVLPSPGQLGLAGSAGVTRSTLQQALQAWQPQTLILVPEWLHYLDIALGKGWTPPGSLRFVAVGGARVAPELLLRVRDGGLPVYEGYGLSECASVVSLNTPAADRPGTCGRPLPHVRVHCEGGELVMEGNGFLGYLGEPPRPADCAVHSGDIGDLDADGFLRVSGRRKHLLISSFGRNISPEWVESELLAGGCLAQAVVLGDARPHCVALVSPVSPDPGDAALAAHVATVNARLPDYARVRCWARLPRPLTVQSGLLTENGRVRRALFAETFQTLIDQLYLSTEEVTT